MTIKIIKKLRGEAFLVLISLVMAHQISFSGELMNYRVSESINGEPTPIPFQGDICKIKLKNLSLENKDSYCAIPDFSHFMMQVPAPTDFSTKENSRIKCSSIQMVYRNLIEINEAYKNEYEKALKKTGLSHSQYIQLEKIYQTFISNLEQLSLEQKKILADVCAINKAEKF